MAPLIFLALSGKGVVGQKKREIPSLFWMPAGEKKEERGRSCLGCSNLLKNFDFQFRPTFFFFSSAFFCKRTQKRRRRRERHKMEWMALLMDSFSLSLRLLLLHKRESQLHHTQRRRGKRGRGSKSTQLENENPPPKILFLV